MKKCFALFLCLSLLAGCGNTAVPDPTTPPIRSEAAVSGETMILLSDEGIAVNGGGETKQVFTSRDIIYYEDRDAYNSGNPYGEGEAWERHSAGEAEAHTVVNITAPGTYRVSGRLSAGQLRIDLGKDADEDPDAVVTLILENADITCTVAPAILFLNTYECDGNWSVDTATASVDTSSAGANLILEGTNVVRGSHVAKIFKDKDGEKKLWKQDGAIYAYMSMNVSGSGSLHLTADNEGIGTELHLTINGGNIRIDSDNDGINTNEDGVSVTTINGGSLQINAGLGAEGDGIDSNGYLVINGGTVISAAKPVSDAGLDSSMGSFVNGGTVIALGAAMDWAESESGQVTLNLQFADRQEAGTPVEVRDLQGNVVFSLKPEYEEGMTRGFQGIILSSPDLKQGETYLLYAGGVQMQYTGSDVGFGPPAMGGKPGGEQPPIPGELNGPMPDDFDPGSFTPPEDGSFPDGEIPEGGFGGRQGMTGKIPEPKDGMAPPPVPEGGMPSDRPPQDGNGSTEFYMADMVNAFSGLAPAQM